MTRASRIDFDDLEATIRRMESECKASWDHLKVIAKHDGPTPMRQKMSEFLADSAERIIVLGIIQRRVLNRSVLRVTRSVAEGQGLVVGQVEGQCCQIGVVTKS